MTAPRSDDIPEGFVLSDKRGPFTSHNGPTYHKQIVGGLVHGFRVLDRHCNNMGILHGGMATAFMDGVLAGAVFRAAGRRSVTLRLTVDFLDIARAGEWLEGRVGVVDLNAEICHVQGEVRRAEVAILRARGIFKLMRT